MQSNRFSGAENVVCQIVGMMKDETDIQTAYCSRDGQIREALKERKIQFHPINDLTVSEVKRVIKEYNPDIIHAHDMRASFVAAQSCKNIKLISHIHNNAFDSRGISVKSMAYIFAAMKAKHIFWVSNSSFNGYYFHSLFKKKSSILYNIIDKESLYSKMYKDKNEYAYDIVYLGRLTYQKNPHRLLDILHVVIDRKPDVKIAIIGTGEVETEIHKKAKELKLAPNVEFLGFQSNPYKMLHDAKLMVMTSRWEGTPMCVLESMALGVPIVSTPTDGIIDLITSDENGFLSDDDSELADAMISIIEDKSLQQKMSANTRKRFDNLMDKNEYRKEIIKAYKI